MSNESITLPIPQARVLVVDQESHSRSALVRSLTSLGYRADEADSGSQALDMLKSVAYDLAMLDVCLPDIDGVEVMRRARQMQPELRIIVLTASPSLESAIAAVKCQAADYLLRPADADEIEAAITAALQQRAQVLRRRDLLDMMGQTLSALHGIETPQETAPAPPPEGLLSTGPVTLDRKKRLASVSGSQTPTVTLTRNETAILAHLMTHPDQVISCRELVQAALGYTVTEQEARSIVRPHIFRLRKKLEVHPSKPSLIRTMRGRGYLFSP
ncbi:MAG: response regulator transcription factor [Anaerolineae bacterium]|jgi:two-component system KDP operon response regulator KdpE